MQFVGKVISSVSEFYRDINPSTLSGAIDVVVVEDVNTGELTCSPFHVRFGKLQLLRPQEKAVELRVNGELVGEQLRMKVGEAGETFFVLSREELGMGSASDLPPEYLTSPLIGPETPVPLESIEEFKLTPMLSNVNETLIPATPATSPTFIASTTSSTDMMALPSLAAALSPEWKWEWGDLPIKTKDSVPPNNATNTNQSQEITSSITAATVELYEYLSDREYLRGSYEVLSRFPGRSMICRIYKIDRGLHFQTFAGWPEGFNLILNESTRVLEGDFLVNPSVVVEESSRLVYQFSWENRKVILSGSVGAAVVFYAQVYARILPLELILKLSEVASIRLAKRKLALETSLELIATTNAAVSANTNTATIADNMDVLESEKKTEVNVKDRVQDVITEGIVNNPVSSASSKPGWRAWWSRNSTATEVIVKPAHGTEIVTESSSSITIDDTIDSDKVVSSFDVQTEALHVPRPLNTFSPVHALSPQLLISSGSPKALFEPPGTLSALLSESGGVGGVDGSVNADSTGLDRSPSKRIIQRASAGALSATSTTNSNSNSNSNSISTSSASPASSTSTAQQFIKSLRLPSHLLKKLNLKPGVNSISYTVNTRLQGTATCQSRIFLWRSDSRIVISDIDGTITKSDALGHLFTMVGKDWTHVGVAQLYSKIAANGYEFLYLTSRAIGQAAATRGYLKGVEQDRLQLPDGPVIMSPDRLFTALHREVIQRRPDEFKIACLRDIQKLFVPDEEEVSSMGSGVVSSSEDEFSGPPSRSSRSALTANGIVTGNTSNGITSNTTSNTVNSTPSTVNINNTTYASHTHTNLSSKYPVSNQNPFYAGFGNRPTDTKSYKAVGISASRIFLINSAGDLKLDKLTFYTPYSASSYSKLTEEVDKVFPPVRSPSSLTRAAGDEAFTDFQYWHGVRMDLVQLALGSVSRPDALVYEKNGKPVSPETLQMQLGSISNTTSSLKSPTSSTATTSSMSSLKNPPALPPPRDYEVKDANDADLEDADESESEDEEGQDLLDSMDSFPFI